MICIGFELRYGWFVFMLVYVDINYHPFLVLYSFLIDLHSDIRSCCLDQAALRFRLFESVLTSFFAHVRTFCSCSGSRCILELPALVNCLCLVHLQITVELLLLQWGA